MDSGLVINWLLNKVDYMFFWDSEVKYLLVWPEALHSLKMDLCIYPKLLYFTWFGAQNKSDNKSSR